MLHVDGREDVDARLEHGLDVLPALRVLLARRVGVRELVDQAQLGAAQQDRREIHLLDFHPRGSGTVGDAPAREELEPGGLRGGLRAVVRLEVADHDVASRLGLGLPLLQHPVRLADPGRHAEEDLVAAGHAPGRYAPSTLCTTRPMSLIPTNGAMRPPSP